MKKKKPLTIQDHPIGKLKKGVKTQPVQPKLAAAIARARADIRQHFRHDGWPLNMDFYMEDVLQSTYPGLLEFIRTELATATKGITYVYRSYTAKEDDKLVTDALLLRKKDVKSGDIDMMSVRKTKGKGRRHAK